MNFTLTNAAALAALQNLATTQRDLTITNNQVSSGLAVATAADNPAYWAIATQLNADAGLVGATNSALAQGQATLDTATAGINSIITTINSIQTALTAAESAAAPALVVINATLATLGTQLTDAVNAASFDGANILDGSTTGSTAGSISFVSGFDPSSAVNNVTTISMPTQAVYDASGPGSGLLVQNGASGSSWYLTELGTGHYPIATTNAADALSAVNAALTAVTSYSASIGATQAQMTNAADLNSAITTNYDNAVGNLVDADMNTASARLQALQTQEQLGIQSLSIANQDSQLVLRLFGLS